MEIHRESDGDDCFNRLEDCFHLASADDLRKVQEKLNKLVADKEQFLAKFRAVKRKNNVLAGKVEVLQSENGEQKAQIRELRHDTRGLKAKVVVVELRCDKMTKKLEAKMKGMADQWEEKQSKFMQENERKFSKLEVKMAENKEKTENRTLADKVELLEAKNGELQAKLEVAELKSKLVSEEVAKMIEAKLKEMADQLEEKQSKFMQENERKFNELKAQLADKKKKKVKQHRIDAFEFQIAYNSWDQMKRSGNTGIGSDLHFARMGGSTNFGNVVAKFAYATFYFEVLVKNKFSDICIGMRGKDFGYEGGNTSMYVGGFADSWSICSNGHCFTAGTPLSKHFPGGFGIDDTIGCGVACLPQTKERMFFATKNSALFGTSIALPASASSKLFPSVTLCGQGTSVEANFGNDLANKPFRYNIADHKFCC